MNKLLQLISKGGLKDAGAMLKWAAAMSMQFMPGSEKNLKAQRNRSAWEEEREDILERANWLCTQVMVARPSLWVHAPSSRTGTSATNFSVPPKSVAVL